MLITRPVIASVIACALVAVAAPAVSAGPRDTERYLSSYGAPQATDSGVAAAEAQEIYYSSYGPLAPQDATSGSADWLPTALLSVALLLAAIAVIVALRRRRLHTGRRRTARIAV